jgi:exodeoxyribonuclease V alpha subunit
VDDLLLIRQDQKSNDDDLCEELKGTLDHVTFRNDENGYTVARFKTEQSGLVTITGRFTSVNEGEHLTLTGVWKKHPKFGPQFEVSRYIISLPATLKGMEKYLGSGLISGIGPVFAKKICKHFGEEVFEVIENSPERLKEVPGVGKVKAQSLVKAFKSQKAVRGLIVFLQDHDVSPSLAIKIYKEYGEDAVTVLRENPYELADDIFGVGFRTADSVAKKLGMPGEDPRRYRAGLRYVLKEASEDGHVYLPKIELIKMAGELLEADVNAIGEALDDLVQNKIVINDHDRIYLDFLFNAEEAVAEILSKMASGRLRNTNNEKICALVDKIQEVEKLQLASEQVKAVLASYENQCIVLTGGPGTGKSTTVKVIVRMFEKLGKTVRLASPTGRAAKRLEEATGRPASTIHRLLEYKPQAGWGRDADNQLDCKVLVIDETSMVDVPLAYYLLRAIPQNCRLILVGDVDQLPSVGPGSVLRDIIDSGVVRTISLTEIFRQAQGSLIVTNAHRINRGQSPVFDPVSGKKDFRWVREENKDMIGEKLIEIIRDHLSKDFNPMTEIQVLTPMHAGPAGARELNRRLQETCNPPSERKAELKLGDRIFRVGDRVMQTRNNYELDVFNGDIGAISTIDAKLGSVTVQYERYVNYTRNDLDELQLAYAITVHKSQGSEYPCVAIPISTSHWVMLQRNLLYTAVTRAKKFCVIVGQRTAVGRAISNAHTSQRYTNLKCRLMDIASGRKGGADREERVEYEGEGESSSD